MKCKYTKDCIKLQHSICRLHIAARKTKTQLDETRIGLTKLWATAWSINIIFICDGGQTNGQRDGRTGVQGRRTDDETAVQCFRKVLGQTAVAPGCSSRLAALWVRVCLSLSPSVCASCVRHIKFLNLANSCATPLGRDLRPETGDWGLQNWRPENRERGFRLCGAEWKPVYTEQSVPLDGSCKQSELTAWQALSHEKWMMIMTTTTKTTTVEMGTSQDRDVAWNYDGQCWGNCCRS